MSRRRLEQAGLTLLALTATPLSRHMPRSRRRWIFGHQGGQFAGNPKYLFLWIALHRPDLHVTWIGGDARARAQIAALGLRARRRWSPAGIWAALRAGVAAYAHGADDVSLHFSRGALLLNLWHGVGIKATALGDAGGVVARHWPLRHRPLWRALYLAHVTQPDVLVTTSDFMQEHFARQFRLPTERCPQLGYPRLDPLHAPRLRDLVRSIEPVSLNDGRFDEVLVYAPTLRDSGRDFLAEALPDPVALEAALAARNAVLYVKLHPRTAGGLKVGTERIRCWPASADLYAHLDTIDILVTDYSSLLYDHLRVRPGAAILYTFDQAEYVAVDRSLLYDFDAHVAGVRATDFAGLCDVIATGAARAAERCARADAIDRLFWSGSPSCASAAIVAHVERAFTTASVRRLPVGAALAP